MILSSGACQTHRLDQERMRGQRRRLNESDDRHKHRLEQQIFVPQNKEREILKVDR